MRSNSATLRLVLSLCAVAGCAPALSYPYSTTQLVRDSRERGSEALIHYLRQPRADPAVCGADWPEPKLHVGSSELVGELLDALADGDVPPQPTAACLTSTIARLRAEERARTSAPIAETYLDLVQAPSTPERRKALHDLALRFIARGTEADTFNAKLTSALHEREIDASAEPLVREQLTALELGHDRYAGKPVTEAQLLALEDQLLPLFAARLASPSLQRAARAELIRRRAVASVYSVVREDVPGVVQRVLESGRNAIDPRVHPILALWLEPVIHGALAVRQDLERGEATLLLAAGKRRSVIPSVPLERRLWFRAQGISPAVTLCAPAERLETAPCVGLSDVTIDATHARVDATGTLRLADTLSPPQLLASLSGLHVRAAVGSKRADQHLPLVFDPPKPLVLRGRHYGANGPTLEVTLREHARIAVFDVRSRDARWVAILDPTTRSEFAIVSAGAQGAPGSDGDRGSDGNDGTTGSNASCMSDAGDGSRGSDGGRGDDGEDGQRGGDGGDIHVRLICEQTRCQALHDLAKSVVRSEAGVGGPGGDGGDGGRGGDGGEGGQGTSCQERDALGHTHTTWKSSGWKGMDGMDGSNGSNGSSGPRGQPGRVVIAISKERLEPDGR